MRFFINKKIFIDITKKMNIAIELPTAPHSTTFFNETFNSIQDYFAFRNEEYDYDYIDNKYLYSNRKYKNNRIKRLNTTEFFRLSILHNHKYHCQNNTNTLHFINWWYDIPDDDWNTLSCVLGHIKHYGEKIATKILVNGKVKWIIYDKTAKGGKYFSQTTSIYVNKLKRFMESYNIDFFTYSYNDHTISYDMNEYDGDEECCITYENVKGQMCKTPCGHIFEKSALCKWLKQEAPASLCPYCKQVIPHTITESHKNKKTWKEWVENEYVSGLVLGMNA